MGQLRTAYPTTPDASRRHGALATPDLTPTRAGHQPPPMSDAPQYMQGGPAGLHTVHGQHAMYSPDLSPPPSQRFSTPRASPHDPHSLTPVTPRTPSGTGRTPRTGGLHYGHHQHTPPTLRSPPPHDLRSPFHGYHHHHHPSGHTHSDRLPSAHSHQQPQQFTLNSLPEDQEDKALSSPLPSGNGTGVFIPGIFRQAPPAGSINGDSRHSTAGAGSGRTPSRCGSRNQMSAPLAEHSGLMNEAFEGGYEQVSVSADLPPVRTTQHPRF